MNIMKVVPKGSECSTEKTRVKKNAFHYSTGISENYAGAGASIIKNDRIHGQWYRCPQAEEGTSQLVKVQPVRHPDIKHVVTVIKEHCLRKVLVDKLEAFPQYTTVILEGNRETPTLTRWMWKWLNEILNQRILRLGHEDPGSELEALDILLTWEQ